mmetsp:Transcript_31896/g.42124  ORF Transcript_31896/g.42124 Transcript_31896/m.42124 type:complete len:202 (-) Transcript_31896:241-846(-)
MNKVLLLCATVWLLFSGQCCAFNHAKRLTEGSLLSPKTSKKYVKTKMVLEDLGKITTDTVFQSMILISEAWNEYRPAEGFDLVPVTEPVEITGEIWVGLVAGLFPFVWAAYEFWKRIDVQQRCGVCGGSGLVLSGPTGQKYSQARKCYACGGFIPFVSWKRFWLANLAVGNGGILQRPAANYEELSEKAKKERKEGTNENL